MILRLIARALSSIEVVTVLVWVSSMLTSLPEVMLSEVDWIRRPVPVVSPSKERVLPVLVVTESAVTLKTGELAV